MKLDQQKFARSGPLLLFVLRKPNALVVDLAFLDRVKLALALYQAELSLQVVK